jgi:UDP-4-amino-4,6-dideoxy-N-acetyl-beta-L-altrosamine transaminase
VSDGRPIPSGRQWIDDADVEAVVSTLRSDWLTQGPAVARFEAVLAERCGARHAVAVTNGTAALHLACLAVGVGPGDVGITSAISFVASANCLRYVGAEVAFADVEPDTGLVDTGSLAARAEALAARGQAPKVIVPVDLTGQPAELVAVRRIADAHGALVIEDAAHSLGATYEHGGSRHRVGDCAHADLAILSFHPVKHITTGEGGAVLTNDATLALRLRDLRTHGIHKDPERLERAADDPWSGPWYYEMAALGFNYRITDLQCALGVSQMAKLDGFLARRRELARVYDAALGAEPLAGRLRPLLQHPGRANAYHLYVVQVSPRDGERAEDVARRRKALFLFLRDRGILCQVHYIPIPWQPYYRDRPAAERAYAGAEAYYAGALSLPLYPAMRDADQARVIEALGEWAAGEGRAVPA